MGIEVSVYTDGSSIGNGKPTCTGGWSCVFFLHGKMYVRYGHLSPESTNNRAEITGILYAIDLLRDKPTWQPTVHSDSQYCVKSINEWRHKWKRNGYEGLKNSDLLIPLFEMWDHHGNAKIEWVRGHNGDPGNEMADEYAGLGSRNIKREKSSDKVDIRMATTDWKSSWQK